MAVLNNTGVRAGASGAGSGGKTWKADKSVGAKPENGYPRFYHNAPGQGDTKRWTINLWAKKGKIKGSSNTDVECLFGWHSDSDSYGYLGFYGDGIRVGNRPKSGTIAVYQTSARFVDINNWYNIHFVWDSENATANDRMRLWVNGVRITSFSTQTTPDRYQEWVGGIGRDSDDDPVALQLFQDKNTGGQASVFEGKMYSPTYIDGGCLDPTVFGEFDDYGNWREKSTDIYDADGDLIVGTGVFRNLNAGFQWSHFWTGNFLSGYTAASAFNNSTEDAAGNASVPDNSNTITWKPVMDLVAKTDIRLYMFVKGSSGGGVDFTVNNVSKWDDAKSELGNNTDGWYSIGKTITASHGLTFARDANGTNQTALFAIEVDGCILVDNNVNRGFNLRFGAGHWNSSHMGHSWWTPDNQGAIRQPRGMTGLPPEQTVGGYWKDPDISSLVLAMEGDSTSDIHHSAKGSGSAKTRTVQGNTTTSSDVSCIHNGTIKFDGSGDYIDFADHADWDIGTGDYCLETWCYPVETNDEYIIGRRISGGSGDWWGLNFWGNGGSVGGSVRGGHKNNHSADGQELEVSYAWKPNQWHHLAVTRESGTSRLFVGGQCVGIDTSDTYDITSSNVLFVGGAAGYSFDGYIGMVRLYKGAHKYNKNFIPAKPVFFANQGFERNTGNYWLRMPISDVPTGSAWTPDDDDTTNTRPEYGYNTRSNIQEIWSLGADTSGYGTTKRGVNRGTFGRIVGIYDIQSNGPGPGGSYYQTAVSSMVMTSGKYYWAVEYPQSTANNYTAMGVAWNHNYDHDDRIGDASGGFRWDEDGSIHANGATAWTTNLTYAWQHVCHIAFDADTRKIWVGHTGGWAEDSSGNVGNPAAGTYPIATLDESPNGEYVFTITLHGGNFNNSRLRLGDYIMAYEGPDNFVPPQSYWLPEPTVVDPKKYFFCKKYSGSNGSQNITGFDFKPGLIAIKQINDNSTHWQVHDILRGPTKGVHFNDNAAEWTDANAVTAFNSNGITVGGSAASHNASGKDYMLYGWYFGDTAKTNNTDGTMTPTGQWSNPATGTSMVTFSNVPAAGNTIGHGLGAKPDFALLKKRSNTGNFDAWHWCQSDQAAGHITLPAASAEVTGNGNIWNNTAPSNTVWTFGSDLVTTNDWIMYFFRNINGLQKFGKYRGNAHANGPYVNLGFEPAVLWIKSRGDAEAWYCIDNVRATYNQRNTYFKVNTGDQSKSDDDFVDFLSNGFKVRDSTDHVNGDGDTYLYCAWAASAFKYNNATV